MIRVHLTPTDLGRVRFGSSALLEVSLSLRGAAERRPGSLLANVGAPVAKARRALRLGLTEALHEDGRYVPDFVPPRGMGVDHSMAADLQALRRLPARRLEQHLAFAYPDGVPADLELFRRAPQAAVGVLADELGALYAQALAPLWPALRAIIEADLLYRARRLAVEGLEAVFADLHPAVRWRDGVVEIDAAHDADLHPRGRGMTLMPTVFAWPRVYAVADPCAHPGLAYPPRGVGLLDEALAPRRRLDRVARLLGVGRAAVLRGAAEPVTTQELALRLGVTPSAVSQHLSVLSEVGLVAGTRVGQRVYYQMNDEGAEMLGVLERRVGPRMV